jgi:hypothetical protein
MRFPSGINRRDVKRTLRAVADSYFRGLMTEDRFTVQHVQTILKRGVASVKPIVYNVSMFLRSAEEARRNDIFIGVQITGSHVAAAPRTMKFRVGDVIISDVGRKYDVINTNLKAGGTYWVLDLQVRQEDG